jgi:hypothetical protein
MSEQAQEQKPPTLRMDEVQVEGNFSRGIVRDTMKSMIPEGGVYDSVDFMLEKPGRAYKRGPWTDYSAALPAPPSMVGTLHAPTRVVAISNNHLYDVTDQGSGPVAVDSGDVQFSPRENPPNYVGRLILCDGTLGNQPKKISTTGPTGVVTLSALGGNPPYAAYSAVYSGRIVLARGNTAAGSDYSDAPFKNRIWFSELPDVEATWDTATKYVDTTYEITGLASIQGVLLIFSPHFTERLIGGVPPGVTADPESTDLSGNMELQPVGGVGCLDARSIVTLDNQIIFGSQEGIFVTNGVGFVNLMESTDHAGMLSFWRGLFPEGQVRGIVCGMLNRDYLLVSTHSTDGSDHEFVCYLPSKTWWRTKNTSVNMYAAGATEQETTELYAAMRIHPHVSKFSSILGAGRSDGNAVPIEPNLETRMFGNGPGLKAYGFGRVSYDMHALVGNPTLEVSQAIGLEGTNFLPVFESPLPKTNPVAGIPRENRARFRLFKDSQALYLRFDQHGASDKTELFLVEVEHRPYNLPADGE